MKRHIGWLCALVLIGSTAALAFPDKPIQYVIPFAAGGALVWNTLAGLPTSDRRIHAP